MTPQEMRNCVEEEKPNCFTEKQLSSIKKRVKKLKTEKKRTAAKEAGK